MHDYTSIRQDIELIRGIEEKAMSARSLSERVADVIGTFCGSMRFVVIHDLPVNLRADEGESDEPPRRFPCAA